MSWKWRAYDDRKRLCLSSKTKRRHILDILFELPTLRNSLFSTWNKKRLLWTVKHRETLLSATQSAADFFQQSDSIHYFELYVIDGETYCTQKWHKFFFILVIKQLDVQNFFFYSKFISCLYMFRASCAHRQEVKIVLYSFWYRHTCRWPSGAQVERVLWFITKINILRCTVSKTSKFVTQVLLCRWFHVQDHSKQPRH